MKNKMMKFITGLALAVSLSASAINPMAVMAAENQETQVLDGTSDTKDIPVTVNVKSVYMVSLPASLDLEYGSRQDIMGYTHYGYYTNIKYGAAGKIASKYEVYIKEISCDLTGETTGEHIIAEHKAGIHGRLLSDLSYRWVSAERENSPYWILGGCDYNGVSISNPEYDYCCDGHCFGVDENDIPALDDYAGNLVVEFGLRNYTP